MIWTPHATVATIVEHEGKFLLVEELVDENIVLNQPAGHVEQYESILDAALRETLEETGWQVNLMHFIGLYTYLAPNDVTYHRYSFAAEPIKQLDNADLDEGIIRPLWLTKAQVNARKDDWRSPLLGRCIDDYLAGARFPLSIIYEHPQAKQQ